MRLRNVKNAKEIVNKSLYVIKNPNTYKGNFSQLFINNAPIYLEIGMGKGNFLINMAIAHPEINFIGIEKYESVMVRALEKLDNLKLNNIKLIRYDATYIKDLFDKEISLIYLNFSDPWPKTKHAKRRLTSPNFLNSYDYIFKDKQEIIMKTDNINLFAYSLVTLSEHGYILKKVSLDLHKEDIPNVMTEYEEKFSKEGIKINYLHAKK